MFEHLHSIRADLLGLPKSDGLFQPAEIAFEEETTKLENNECIACCDDITSIIGLEKVALGAPFN